jgi:hypothetical protein
MTQEAYAERDAARERYFNWLQRTGALDPLPETPRALPRWELAGRNPVGKPREDRYELPTGLLV